MNLSKLLHVTEVGRLSSFSKAAVALHISQSAVTKSVAEVERQLGYAIFHRTSRGALLTDAGRDFVDRAARVLADVDQLFADIAFDQAKIQGRLRVGVCPASVEWLLVEPVTRLLTRYAALALDVTAGSVERITQLLTRGDIDVAIGPHGMFAEWRELKTERAGTVQTALFVRREHPLTKRRSLTPESIAEYPFIATSFVRQVSPLIDALYEAKGQGPRGHIHTIEHFPLVRRIVLLTDAVSVVGAPHAQSKAFRRHFATLDGLNVFPDSEVSCAYRRRWPPKPAAAALIDEVRRSLSSRA